MCIYTSLYKYTPTDCACDKSSLLQKTYVQNIHTLHEIWAIKSTDVRFLSEVRMYQFLLWPTFQTVKIPTASLENCDSEQEVT